ncbi:MAG: BON domain-containing protein [Acidobacteria bacterium]|nr:BON domain-containing protein [Acidobacteriota bacterium]
MTKLLIVVATLFALMLPAVAQKKNSDEQIYDQVRMRLANDPDIKGGNLNVDVKNGVVTVKGRVDKERAQQKIEKVAKKVKGVSSVVNQVKVEP